MDSELYKPFKLLFKVFKTLGMWQDGNQKWKYLIFGFALHFIWNEICLLAYVNSAFRVEKLSEKIEVFGHLILVLTIVLKSFNFLVKIKVIVKLVDTLNELLKFSADERFADRVHVRKQVAFAFKVYKVFWASAIISCTYTAFVPFTTHELPYKASFFIENQSEIGFWIVSVYLIAGSFFNSAICMALDILPVIFMSFAIGLTNELAERLSKVGINAETEAETAFNGPGNMNKFLRKKIRDYKTQKEFVKCVETHKKIKEFVKEIEENFSTMIFIQGTSSSVILCSTAFSMSIVSSSSLFFCFPPKISFQTAQRQLGHLSDFLVHGSDGSRNISAMLLRK
jgi:hypothetical protein